MVSCNRLSSLRSLVLWGVWLLGFSWLATGSVGCISIPPSADGGLQLCSSNADCPSSDSLKYICVLNVCQLETTCVPSKEVCNGKDDDCDGVVDNVVFTGVDAECTLKPLKGPCRQGKKVCKAGKLTCEQVVQPAAKEICGNNIDDNCNGRVDENPPCKCKVGSIRKCYPPNADGCKTNDKGVIECRGVCKTGTQKCNSNYEYGTCTGATLPAKEICDGQDNDCNGKTDDGIGGLGAPCLVKGAKGPCERGKTACQGGTTVCEQVVKPAKEICDGKADEDCDGVIDNGCNCKDGDKRSCFPSGAKGCTSVGNNSYNCKGTCTTGVQVCSKGQFGACKGAVVAVTKEACDGKDDDCDGTPDNGCSCKDGDKQDCGSDTGECKKGKQTCVGGTYGACVGEVKGSPELCDNKDNNCDGKVDESFNVGTACTVGKGECKNTGKMVCKSDKSGTECGVKPKPVQTETCNGKDDDCDGVIDNGFNLGQSCKAGKGECENTGKLVCKSDGTAAECDAKPKAPSIEVCDGKDNDCDGLVDEDPSDPAKKLSRACYTAPKGCTLNGGTYNCQGTCTSGKQFCDSTQAQYAGTCVGEKTPTAEIPGNGIDEDCDGKDGQVANQSCNNRQAAQKWGTNMAACDCKAGETCSARFAQTLCGAGWKVCNFTQWSSRWNKVGSTGYRHIAMTQTCVVNSSSCSIATGVSFVDGNSQLCQQITKNCGDLKNSYLSFFVGPTVLDCTNGWHVWKTAIDNGNISRGQSFPQYYKSEAGCLDSSYDKLGGGLKATGILCCK